MTELVALVLSLTTLFLPQSPSTQAADAVSWPIPGVERPGDGVTAPYLVHETKPNYTGEAMRARVQGLVVMECVVEVDGSVGPVRVTRSVDPVYGLDDAAVRTLKQWRFRPGTKEGTPVRVAIIVEMSFTLGDNKGARPPDPALNPIPTAPLSWPEAFLDPFGRSDTPQFGWIDELAETSRLSVRFARPGDWSILPSTSNGRIVTLHAYKATGSRSLTISESGPAPLTLSTPLSQSALDSFFVQTAQRGFPAGLKPLRSGQLAKVDGLWLWFEMAGPTIDASDAPQAIGELLQSRYSGAHVWSFVTTVNGQLVDVFCTVLHRANATEQEREEDARRAGLEFGAMLRHMTVRPK
jgi:TonB family protein